MFDRFKKLYELSEQIHINEYKKEYEKLIKTDNRFESFDDYLEYEKNRQENLENIGISDKFICRDKIAKNNITIDLYLLHHSFYDKVSLDENYKPLPLTKKKIFEYGVGIIYSAEDGDYSIVGLFCDSSENKDIAIDKYNELKNKIEKSSENEVLNEVENELISKKCTK